MALALRFERSTTRHSDLPDSPAEVAIVGRSNVGKSSLINALANQRQLARVSNTPGRTQTINLFSLPSGATVVDLPGYGYAKVPQRQRRGWQPMIEGYLRQRAPLQLVYVLVDGEIGPTPLDVQMLDWLAAEGITHTVVATKGDRVKPSRRATRRREVADGCRLDSGDVMWVSATKGTGLDELRHHLLDVLRIR
jgi:GTP-binding protein